jgi:hypothetical protein
MDTNYGEMLLALAKEGRISEFYLPEGEADPRPGLIADALKQADLILETAEDLTPEQRADFVARLAEARARCRERGLIE